MIIITGLVALGLVVFLHELGHFIAARACGVVVETFSLGWGPVLLRKKINETEYRLSLLPLGGYCGMKGERAFSEALEKKLDAIPREAGSFYGAHPIKRMIIAFAGPFANLLFAVIAFALVSAVGSEYRTYDNKVIPVSQYEAPGMHYPSDLAGLRSGDRIVELNGTPIDTFSDIQQYVGTRPGEQITMVFERDGQRHTATLTPALDKKTGAGKIGVYPWVPLVVGSVKEGSAAQTVGIQVGDAITAVNDRAVAHYYEFVAALKDKPEQIVLDINRNGEPKRFTLVLLWPKDGEPETGIAWQTRLVTVKGTGFLDSAKAGFSETVNIARLTVKSIGLFFKGVDVTEAVSGPVRITLLIGEVAQTGFASSAELLGIICISLFLMNLLPVPLLDGGLILFSLIEIVLRKPLKPKTQYYVQFIGIAFMLLLFSIAMFGDIRYLTR